MKTEKSSKLGFTDWCKLVNPYLKEYKKRTGHAHSKLEMKNAWLRNDKNADRYIKWLTQDGKYK
jgi:hypothetical protein